MSDENKVVTSPLDVSPSETSMYSNGNTSVKDVISKASSPRGELSKAASNAFFGINHRNVGVQVKPNSDNHGLTFFTRPRLNLSYDNISGVRNFTPLLTGESATLQRAVRVLLDPVGSLGVYDAPVHSPLVDEENAFIPMLTNLLTSMSGWPDSVMDTHTSPVGRGNESWAMVDSLPMDYSVYDLNATFRNIQGDPISLLLHIWTQYAARVSEGSMVPYPDVWVENEKDYETRIYRLILDPTRTYVQKIAACGAAFPYVNPIGAHFNFDTNSPLIQDNLEISVPFKAQGMMHSDPILIREFNDTVSAFNLGMHDAVREQELVKVAEELKDIFNFRCYPRIEPNTLELEWWVPRDEYIATINKYNEYVPAQYVV